VARPERFELPTLWFEARCSIQLSYGRVDQIYMMLARMAEKIWRGIFFFAIRADGRYGITLTNSRAGAGSSSCRLTHAAPNLSTSANCARLIAGWK
jgi:hypothetical protein